jgi:hypothetical protein
MREKRMVKKVWDLLRSKNPPAKPNVPRKMTMTSPILSPRRLRGNWKRPMQPEEIPLSIPTWLKERLNSAAMKGRSR